jgi:hypothetical protein
MSSPPKERKDKSPSAASNVHIDPSVPSTTACPAIPSTEIAPHPSCVRADHFDRPSKTPPRDDSLPSPPKEGKERSYALLPSGKRDGDLITVSDCLPTPPFAYNLEIGIPCISTIRVVVPLTNAPHAYVGPQVVPSEMSIPRISTIRLVGSVIPLLPSGPPFRIAIACSFCHRARPSRYFPRSFISAARVTLDLDSCAPFISFQHSI